MSSSIRLAPLSFAAGLLGLALSTAVEAHVSFASGTAYPLPIAGKSWVGTLNVPHGCADDATGAGYDNERVEVEIPATFTGVRPSHSAGLRASVTKVTEGAVTRVSKVTWTQASTDLQESDTHYYPLVVRGTLPNAPFTALEFRTVQYCNNGTLTDVWEGVDVPKVRVLPARTPGWNQYTIPAGVSLTTADVKAFFADAQIVWAGNKGYSVNAETQAQIGRTAGKTALVTSTNTDVVLNPGDVIWVRY